MIPWITLKLVGREHDHELGDSRFLVASINLLDVNEGAIRYLNGFYKLRSQLSGMTSKYLTNRV